MKIIPIQPRRAGGHERREQETATRRTLAHRKPSRRTFGKRLPPAGARLPSGHPAGARSASASRAGARSGSGHRGEPLVGKAPSVAAHQPPIEGRTT